MVPAQHYHNTLSKKIFDIVGKPDTQLRIIRYPFILQAQQMDITEEFQKHVDECRHMARFTRDLQSKVMWNRMAERWGTLVATEQAKTRQRAEARTKRAHSVHRRVDQSRAA